MDESKKLHKRQFSDVPIPVGAISLSHHKRQFKDINSLLVCLQSRRDDMFIENVPPTLFSPVGTICVVQDIR